MQRKIGKHLPLEADLPPQIGRNPRLERLAQRFDWDRLGAVVRGLYAAPTGRPSYPPLMLVKVLLLQQWYAASAPELAAALCDRLSFRRFVGLGLADETPHSATISRFRQPVTARGLAAALFAEVRRQLAAHGLVVKAGTLLAATLVPAQARRPTGPAQPGAQSPTDPDAAWSGRGAKAHLGYKVQRGVDAGAGLIRTACLTAAQIAERTVADTLIPGAEVAVYAGRAYESKQRRRWLQRRGIKDRIMHRAHQDQARLPYWPGQRNRLIARVRAPVEQVVGTLKRLYRYRRVRYLGLARNTTELWCKGLAYNRRRAERRPPRPATRVMQRSPHGGEGAGG